jgi:16S rRNA processing protein RimM
MIQIDDQTYYRVAKLVKSHGVRGEIKIEPLTPYFNLCDFSKGCWVSDRQSKLSFRTIQAIQWNGHSGFVMLSGLNDRNESDKFVGGFLLLDRSKLPEPADGEHYVYDLMGLDVFTEDGRRVGTLTDIQEGPEYDLYEVTLTGTQLKKLIPAVQEIIRSLDVKQKRMVIHDMPGLLDDPEPVLDTELIPEKNARADD